MGPAPFAQSAAHFPVLQEVACAEGSELGLISLWVLTHLFLTSRFNVFKSMIWLESSRKSKLNLPFGKSFYKFGNRRVRMAISERFCRGLPTDRALPSLKGILSDLHC